MSEFERLLNALTMIGAGTYAHSASHVCNASAALIRDQAEEIERLRLALSQIIEHQDAVGGQLGRLSGSRKIAEEALRGRDGVVL